MEIGNKGISRLSVIQVRASHSDKAEVVTQLLFGDHYTITGISEDSRWARVQIHYDNYEGWIDVKQHTNISEAYFDQINNADYKICTDITSTILYKKHHTTIVLGSILPISTNEIFKVEEQLAFNGEAKSLGSKRDAEFLKSIADKYLNAPYQWGGRSPFGIDCSGFTQNVFRITGYDLPRDAWQQENVGQDVEFGNIQLGDLAFFKNQEGKITHVGVVLEDNLTNDGIIHSETSKLTHTLASLKRVLRDQ